MRALNLLIFSGVMAIFAACSGTSIKGVVSDAPNSEVIVKLLDVNKFKVLDTLKTSANGEYSYKLDIEKGQPEFVYIFYKDTKIASLLLQRGDNVKVTSDTVGTYSVVGSPETDKLISVEKDEADFRNQMFAAYAKLGDLEPNSEAALDVRRDITKQYISYYRSRIQYIMENSKSLTCIPVLTQTVGDLVIFGQATDALHFRSTLDSLKTVYPDSKYVKSLEDITVKRENLLNLKSQIDSAPEAGFPDIELPDIHGNKVKLSSVDSKLVLIYFWAAASSGQKMFNLDFLKPIYEEFQQKGLEIYAVSLDTDKNSWADVVKNQNLKWINVCDGLGFNSVAARLYNVSQVPYVYVIKDGKLLPDPGFRSGDSLRAYLQSSL